MKTAKNKKSLTKDLSIFNGKVFHTLTGAETRKLGKQFARVLKPSDIVFFNGELGAGKTTFIQGIMTYFGIKRFVTSASFMLVSEFETKSCNLYHLDLYRLDKNSVLDIGIEEYLFGTGISLVEWSQKLERFNIKKRWEINMEYEQNGRKIKIKRYL